LFPRKQKGIPVNDPDLRHLPVIFMQSARTRTGRSSKGRLDE
jgi:hypothetical protein